MAEGLKVLVMCCDGFHQRYLAQRIHQEFTVCGLVVQSDPNSKGSLSSRIARYKNPVEAFHYLLFRLLVARYRAYAQPTIEQSFFINGNKPEWPTNVPTVLVGDINDHKVVEFVKTLQPHVICVNGTNLLRKPVLDLIPSISYGIINMHTGLSPYSRGGNCNLFMLLEAHPELVGVTIHYIDSGVDSGDIIISAQTPMDAADNYEMIDAKTFRLGIDLMIAAIRQVVEGRAERVRQWEKGRLYLRKTGYVYKPYHRVMVNRLLKRGLVKEYLADKKTRDAGVRLVGQQS